MSEHGTGNGRGPITFSELSAGLIWPHLLRAAPMALHPSRIGVAFIFVALLMGFGALVDWVVGPVNAPENAGAFATPYVVGAMSGERGAFGVAVDVATDAFNGFAMSALSLQPMAAMADLGVILVGGPQFLVSVNWLLGIGVGAALLAGWCVAGGAISRMAVCDFAGEAKLTIGEGIGFALPRARHFVLSILGPLLLFGAIALLIAAGGWVLLSIPALDVLAGLGYGLFLAASFVVVFGLLCLAAGGSLILPAIATEATDWFDGIQRAYAYVLGRTSRLIIYAAVLVIVGAISYAVAGFLTATTINAAAGMSQAWRGEDAPRIFATVDGSDFSLPETPEQLAGTEKAAANLAGVWVRLAVALLASFVVSFYFTASSILYLLCRRVNDEQDIHEIWMPGMIESTMAPADSGDEAASHGG